MSSSKTPIRQDEKDYLDHLLKQNMTIERIF